MNDVVGELVNLVGGSSTSQRRSFSSSRHQKTNVGHSVSQKAHNFLKKNNGLNKSDEAFHNIADGKSQSKPKPKAKQPIAPEKVIPLKGDDNAGSDDFSEFNG